MKIQLTVVYKRVGLTSVDLWTSRASERNSTYLASKARANTPAASGAAADVPECVLVHFP